MWIATRTSAPSTVTDPDGLYAAEDGSAVLLAPAPQVSALERHPRLPVIYGLGCEAHGGRLHAWSLDGAPLTDVPTGGMEPCSVAVSPDGKVLAVANYGGSVARFDLDERGVPRNPEVMEMTGSGPDPDRQRGSHPHHVAFVRRDLVLTDLGADAVIVFAWRHGLTEQRRLAVPPGTGPRHLAHLGAGRVAISGELNSTVLVGSLDDDGVWEICPSTLREADDGVRNYPSDIVAAADGRMAYVANRGIDTVASILCTHAPELLGEHDPGGDWPQNLFIDSGRVLVACRDSDTITAMPLRGGVARDGAPLLTVDAPSWIEG
ncbi:lactonase family protein [Mariniluteicoccus flavus]